MNETNQKILMKMRHELELLELELLQFKLSDHPDNLMKALLVQQKEVDIAIRKYLYDKKEKEWVG